MYRKINLLLCISFVLSACAVATSMPLPTSTPVPTETLTPAAWDLDGWNTVWHDEFDGTELDRSNWTFDIGGNGWGNAEWEAYTDKPENVHVEDGMLVITAIDDPSLPAGRPHSSARIKTQGLHS